MKKIKNMNLGELAAFVSSHLREHGINAVLSGGACVAVYSLNQYQSYDLDFIENFSTSLKKLKEIMSLIGFMPENRYFKHPDTQYFVEFPPGPLTVGDEPVKEIIEREFVTGTLTLISPTECIKDRLAGYYHWHDEQCLEQAILVAANEKIHINELKRWSAHEGKSEEFKRIMNRLKKSETKGRNL